jgi:hypothetical protein
MKRRPSSNAYGATAFLAALVQTGYTIHWIAVMHLIVGVLLLANRFVPLAIALFAPLHRQQRRVSYCPRAVRIADGDRVSRLGTVPRVEVPGSVSPDAQSTRQRGVIAHAPRSHVWVLGRGPRTRCSGARPPPKGSRSRAADSGFRHYPRPKSTDFLLDPLVFVQAALVWFGNATDPASDGARSSTCRPMSR